LWLVEKSHFLKNISTGNIAAPPFFWNRFIPMNIVKNMKSRHDTLFQIIFENPRELVSWGGGGAAATV
jgi:hypothetical protein